MKKLRLTLLIFFAAAGILHAQRSGSTGGAYLMPRQIFVGDPAILVLPLPSAAQNGSDITLTKESSFFPSDENIDFHKITLERRSGGSRLIIEFTAFASGVLELPVIEIGGEYFSGLVITVNSILDSRSNPSLSEPAHALAMPGTAFMIYGFMAAFVFSLSAAIWFVLKGRAFLREFKAKWKLKKLFSSLKKTEKRLHRAILKGADKRVILDKLSDEFRIFLSVLTGENCSAMTAREFELLAPDFLLEHGLDPLFFGKFFRECDKIRFSGANIASQDIFTLLDDLRCFLDALEKTKIGGRI